MCIGAPMEVLELADPARCRARDGREEAVSMLLLGERDPGAFVLVHCGTAMRDLGAAEAALIADALDGLAAARDGDPFEHLFADLVDREPQLPPHLRGQDQREETQA